MNLPSTFDMVSSLARKIFPNESVADVDTAVSVTLGAWLPGETFEQMFHRVFKWANDQNRPETEKFYVMAVAIASAMCQLTDEDFDLLAARRNAELNQKPTEDTLSLDIKVKRCLTCNGYFDTPTGDYCPRCQYAISEDDGAADLDLYA